MNRRQMFRMLTGASLLASAQPVSAATAFEPYQCAAVRFGPTINGAQRLITVRVFADEPESKAAWDTLLASGAWHERNDARDAVVECGVQFAMALEEAAKRQ